MGLVNLKRKDDYAILEMNRGKANPINIDLSQAIIDALDEVKSDPTVRGLIITGNTPGYFSVGLDLKELYYYDESRIEEFWSVWDKMVMDLITFPKPLIAAINGYSPAGGCVIAVTCDYRIMAEDEKFVIGLNETSVGIAVPEYIFLMYQFWIGKNNAYQFLMDGKLLNVAEAKESGLVNEVTSMENLMLKAEKKMKFWLSKPDKILHDSKMNLRAQLLRELRSMPDIDSSEKLKSWFDPKSRAVMKMIVDSLTK